MALRRNLAERVPIVESLEEREANISTYDDKIVDISTDEAIRRLRNGETHDLGRIWLPDVVRNLPLGRALTSVLNAVVDASVPIIIFAVASLALFVSAAVLTNSSFVAGEIEVPSYTLRPELPEWEQTLLGTWQHWDGLWYLKIATQGYDDYDYSTAFFPLYPLTVRIVGSLFNFQLLLAGVFISTVSYLVALVFLYKLARMEIGEAGARRSLIYVAIFPTSFFFLAVYTESMFLALSVAIFFYARKGRWTIVGILSLLASLTRSTGLLLLLPLFIEYLHQRDFNLRAIKADILSLSLVPAGTTIYAAFNFFAFGDPLTFIRAQVHWERAFTMPWQTLAIAWESSINDANIPLVTPPDGTVLYQVLYISNQIGGNVFNLAFLALGLGLTAIAFKKLRPAYGVYALLVLAVPLFNPSNTAPLLSMPRFIVVLFPLFFVLAMMGKNKPVHWVTSAAFLTTLFLFFIRFASWYWVA